MANPAQLEPEVSRFRLAAFDFGGAALTPAEVVIAPTPAAIAPRQTAHPRSPAPNLVEELITLRSLCEKLVIWATACEQRLRALEAGAHASGAHPPRRPP